MNCNAFIGCTQGADCPCGLVDGDESTPLYTANSDSSNPGYPFELLDAPGNFWDECNWWQRIVAVCLTVAICSVLGGMVVGHLVGLK